MTGIGIALAFIGYSAGLYGYCLLRGYNITPKDLFSTTWPPKSVGNTIGRAVGSAAQGAAKVIQNSRNN